VAEIEFLEWTESDHLRHAKFVGLREDKDPRSVVKERSGGVLRSPPHGEAVGPLLNRKQSVWTISGESFMLVLGRTRPVRRHQDFGRRFGISRGFS
jgi:hypothetical protein